MTAKELIEAAKEVLSSRDPACSHIWNAHRSCQWCHRDRRDVYVDDIARHILSTVRPDDDEPVTVERLEADEWKWNDDEQQWWRDSLEITFDSTTFSLWIDDSFIELRSMGHLRRLVAALGE